jgi:hypothetical protein
MVHRSLVTGISTPPPPTPTQGESRPTPPGRSGSQPTTATPEASSSDGDGLLQVGTDWFETLLEEITSWFAAGLRRGYQTLAEGMFSTPVPSSTDGSLLVVPPASDEPWHSIYTAVVGGEVTVLALVVLFVAVQMRHLFRIGNLGSGLEQRRSRYGGIIGSVAIVTWYWVAVVVLYGVDTLTMALLPRLAEVGAALANLLPTTLPNPALTLILATVGGVSMVLVKMLYLLRDILLYIFVYGMPLGLALAFGNVPVISRVAGRLCRQFVPLAILPLPAAVLLRGLSLLLGSGGFSPASVLLRYAVAVGVPILILLVSWKTFTYASPLTASALGVTARVASTAGGIAALGYVGAPHAATTAARYGTWAGATQAIATRAVSDASGGSAQPSDSARADGSGGSPDPGGGTGGHEGVESYRRLSDDPRFR